MDTFYDGVGSRTLLYKIWTHRSYKEYEIYTDLYLFGCDEMLYLF